MSNHKPNNLKVEQECLWGHRQPHKLKRFPMYYILLVKHSHTSMPHFAFDLDLPFASLLNDQFVFSTFN